MMWSLRGFFIFTNTTIVKICPMNKRANTVYVVNYHIGQKFGKNVKKINLAK